MLGFRLRSLGPRWIFGPVVFRFLLVSSLSLVVWLALSHPWLCPALLFLQGIAFSFRACLLDSKARRKCSHFVGTTCAPFRPLFLLTFLQWIFAFACLSSWSSCPFSRHDLCPFYVRCEFHFQFNCGSKLSWNLPARDFVPVKIIAACASPSFDRLEFDHTLGFPGEGPGNMTLWSANIGSFRTNAGWKSWSADVCCLQETRIGKTNLRSCCLDVKSKGLRLTTSEPLAVKWHAAGSITPCGGTAIIASESLIQPFDPACDQTGLYVGLYRTQRLNAAWIQVKPRTRALVISVYATTGASQDPHIHARNDELFSQIFALVSQFGQIPVIIAGDLQADPMSYPSIANAVSFHNWHDPIAGVDHEGFSTRPLTFSRDGAFSGADDATSSIDAILLNQTAFFALESAEVVPLIGKQHRPLKCVFRWEAIDLVGFIHLKSAPFQVETLEKAHKDDDSPSLWDRFEQRYHDASDSDTKWDVVNDFLIHSLLHRGATWGNGPRSRGHAPVFVAKKIAPAQHRSGCAATKRSTKLFKLLGRLNELFCRLSRSPGGLQDQFDTRQTAFKAFRTLQDLEAPFCWSVPTQPTLTDVFIAKQWTESAAKLLDAQIRHSRIKRWKQKISQSAQTNCQYIYQHLKNRAQDEPPNLVVDHDGHIVYQPDQALDHINDAWDTIFSANILCEQPCKVLATVWPQIQDKSAQLDLPDVTSRQLFETIQRRKIAAAPGFDGWRTCELQALPVACFEPIAMFFTFIEQSDQPLPKALVCAKQCILNKKGPASALNKRLITVLPALLLAYTGSRYRQTQDWQRQILPPAILGGVRDRYMASLYNEVRLQIDVAQVSSEPIIGVKLDKSKAFDRIVPAFVAILLLAFGAPKHFVNFFLKIYQGLHRHLTYRGWARPTATTASNGVAQGCSLSLLAMNMYNKVWYHLLEHLPSLSARAFVDDSYIWCKLINLSALDEALRITELWDQLVGQLFNPAKSAMWSSHAKGRVALKASFPLFPIELEFEVLGTQMYTSHRRAFHFDPARFKRIIADIAHIGALAIPMRVKNLLIGSKAIARLTFGTHISQVPKKEMSQMQSAVIRALWAGKPKWRAKWLVQAILGQPHRTDPVIACAVATIQEFVRCCQRSPHMLPLLHSTFEASHNLPHSLWSRVRAACEVLHVDITADVELSFRGSPGLCLRYLQPREIRPLLKQLARQAAYESVDFRTRKDFAKPQGLLNHWSTTALLRSQYKENLNDIPIQLRFQSTVVGCVLTNDRLAAAGWSQSSLCRFCHQAKECLEHLVHDCKPLHEILGPPVLHELGSNFGLMGIVEQPFFLARRRLVLTRAPTAFPAFDPSCNSELWTDGSVLWSERFWITTATFAVVGPDLQVVAKGLVSYPCLNSYVAELWGLLQACLHSKHCVQIFCDCKSVVEHAHQVFVTGIADESWLCQDWWRFLANLTLYRQQQHPQPFAVQWIPAHCFEQLPIEAISDQMAQSRHTSVRHIEQNRKADLVAKEYATALSPVRVNVQHEAERCILAHQRWLAQLHALLPTDADHCSEEASGAPEELDREACCKLFPHWPWRSVAAQFPWKPKIPTGYAQPTNWIGTLAEWEVVCRFLRSLRWKIDDEAVTSIAELTVLFHRGGWKFECDPQLVTYFDLHARLRKAIGIFARCDDAQAFPGTLYPALAKAAGKTLPQGSIKGAAVLIDDVALLQLARLFAFGAGRTLASWKIPVL